MAAFGVYFGCSSASIAVCRDGKTDVIANDLGDRVTPAVVAFTDHDEAVGLAAKQGILRNPGNTVCNVKQLLGRPFGHQAVKAAIESGPVKIIERDGMPLYEVSYREKTCSFAPVEIASIIFKKMMETAQSSEGTADSHDAVIAVPIDFNEMQREAVRDAATIAGFNILRIISEPAASLLAYNIGQTSVNENCTVLVFRVGHQSLDVTVIEVNHGMYRIVASLSEPGLGGHMVDDVMVDHLASEFQRQHRGDCRDNKRSIGKLRNAIETCKHVLSTVNSSQCSVESLFDGIDFNCTLTRSRLEVLSSGFAQKCLVPLDGILTKGNLEKKDIQKVIMCGGCSKMPLLQQQVKDYFPDAEILANIPPDEVVAIGAAVQAGILCGRNFQEVNQFSFTSELPCLSADIVLLVGSDGETNEVVLFKANTPIPIRRQLSFRLSPEQTSFCLHVLEKSSDEAISLAKVVMQNLSSAAILSGVFHVRHDGSLHVTCTDIETNQIQDVLVESKHS